MEYQITITCGFCGDESLSPQFLLQEGIEPQKQKFFDSLIKEGWSYRSCSECQMEGISCPSCTLECKLHEDEEE